MSRNAISYALKHRGLTATEALFLTTISGNSEAQQAPWLIGTTVQRAKEQGADNEVPYSAEH
jgi:hypothetical protein